MRSVVHTATTSAATTATAVGGATGVERSEEWNQGGSGGGGLDNATAVAATTAASSQYGGIAVVDNLQYRKFSESFLRVPCFCIYCTFDKKSSGIVVAEVSISSISLD